MATSGGLWNVDRFVAELAQVRSALNLDRLHLFGSSWGGMLAMQYVLDRRPELESLILCGSPASMIRWVSDCTELLAEETEETRRVIREHEEAGFTGCPEYQAAIWAFTASTYAASTRGRLAWSAPSPKQATTSTTR
jgi:proline iminopeptidase